MRPIDRPRRWLILILGLWLTTGCTPDAGDDDEADAALDAACLTCEADIGGVVFPECDDGRDNDGDGLIDGQDPACVDPSGDDESADPPPPQCRNGEDDDGDGLVDLADRGCGSALDDDESDDPALPACSNGEDDDDDGFTDFPDDPGCGSAGDDDEVNTVGPTLPQCGDGQDNDGDGRVDLADPGCSSVADPREADGELPPACFNSLDDDGDGIVDFPLDPGCAAAGDEDEADGDLPPACGNGLDDDGDGLVDYPDDPGCAGLGDRDEADGERPPPCADGVDNDADGRVDYPDDPGCEAAADANEGGDCGRGYTAVEVVGDRTVRGSTRGEPFASEGTCGGRGAPEVVFLVRVDRPIEALRITTELPGNQLETAIYVRRGCQSPQSEVACQREPIDDVAANTLVVDEPAPGTYYVYVDGAAGRAGDFELRIEQIPLAQCRNGLDDDADGRVDFPTDPGCDTREDTDELDPDVPPLCADDVDNDGDGLVDYPLDIGCRSAADGDEVDLCGQGVVVYEYPVGAPFILDDTSAGGTRQFGGSCGGATATEKVFVYTNPFNARLAFSTNHPETAGDTIVYVRTACTNAAAEIACAPAQNQQQQNRKGAVVIERAGPGDYFVFVDHPLGLGIPFKLSVDVQRLPPGCSDAVDNDGDGFIDGDDVGCATPDDEDERDPAAAPACFNGLDDDGDGLVDHPLDPGCASKGGASEADPDEVPACANGVDDDDDGVIDYPDDIGCAARGDTDEADDRRAPQCNNRIDDDMDGLTDFPLDPGCAARGDLSERNDLRLPACANREDDDRDGLVDYPFDPGCYAAGDPDERDPDPRPACSNGMDDDGDGRADFPRDPGCAAAGDADEADAAFAPQCANARDDDGNGRIDWPDDPGCLFAGDERESSDGAPPPRCADGLDNDDDGIFDLADVGCENARDNDELDPDVAPLCQNGVDDDGDGLVDWPEDDGCAAAGDICEQRGYGLCDGVCVPLLDNPQNCGRCGRACSDGVECIDGRCGELRPRVLECGRSTRDPNEFIRGALVEAEVRVVRNSCAPADDVQAILVPRGAAAQITNQAAAIRAYIENGGVVITEYNISHTIYSAIVGVPVAQGNRNGACQDNIQPAFQFNPQDQFWQDIPFVPIGAATGCGYSINNFPNVTLLGGWNAQNAAFGYIEIGAGRLWLVDIDWQDTDAGFTEQSRDIMAYMIANGAIR
ncbi:MAG: hypothetical protein R3F65_08030 [bacterium]